MKATKEAILWFLAFIILFSALMLIAESAMASIRQNPPDFTVLAEDGCPCTGKIIFKEGVFYLDFLGDELDAVLDAPKSWFTEKNIKLLNGAIVTYIFKNCVIEGKIYDALELHSENPKVEKLVYPKLR